MRDAFAKAITELAAQDERVCLLVGDLGFHLWDNFRERFPDRWLNCGIAEGNMISVAAGLALAGMRPFVYSIASFAVFRCFEQIRVDVCYHDLPVVIVGVGAGLSYAKLGPTHHACEDIAVMRALPGMCVLCPCDPVETRLAVQYAQMSVGPAYIRLGKNGEPALPRVRAGVLREGNDVCLYAAGPVAAVALKAAELLGERGVSVQVENWFVVKPLDEGRLQTDYLSYPLIAVIEEHGMVGGLWTAIAEWRAEYACGKESIWLRFSLNDSFLHNVGGREEALAACGLIAEKIAGKILEALAK